MQIHLFMLSTGKALKSVLEYLKKVARLRVEPNTRTIGTSIVV